MFIAVSKIMVMNTDGTGEHELINQLASEDQAAWSPDGSKVAFAGYLRSGTWEIYVVNADGSNEVRITNNSADDFVPTWSPDGSQIAFTSNRSGRFEVYAVNADGSNLRQLTHAGGGKPDWSLGVSVSDSGEDFSARVQLTFANDTSAPVEVVWVDVEGQSDPITCCNRALRTFNPVTPPISGVSNKGIGCSGNTPFGPQRSRVGPFNREPYGAVTCSGRCIPCR